MACTLANKLTLSRILVIPVIVTLFYLPFSWSHAAAAFFFAVGCVTDWLDGFVARRFKQTSSLGILLDPIADKLIVATCLVLLVHKYQNIFMVIAAIVIIGREIAIAGLREWLRQTTQKTQKNLAVSVAGKIKTLLQMVAIALLLIAPFPYLPYQQYQQWIGYGVLCLAVVLTLYSMAHYLKTALYDTEQVDRN